VDLKDLKYDRITEFRYFIGTTVGKLVQSTNVVPMMYVPSYS